jgi:hypothetical protein
MREIPSTLICFFFVSVRFLWGKGIGGAVSVLSSQFIIGSWIWTDSSNCDFIFHDYLFMCKFFAQIRMVFSFKRVILMRFFIYYSSITSLLQNHWVKSWKCTHGLYSLSKLLFQSILFGSPLKKGTKKTTQDQLPVRLGSTVKLSQGSVMIHPSIGSSCLSSVISLQQIPQKQNLQIFLMVKRELSTLAHPLSLTDIKTL